MQPRKPKIFLLSMLAGVIAVMALPGLLASPGSIVLAQAPFSTEEAAPSGPASSLFVERQITGSSPSLQPWAGDPGNPNYDGRLNATMADRYAVYCKSGELQVWDGLANAKVAAIFLSRLATMPSNTSLQIGAGVFLGRSNNTLTVVIPGIFQKDGINFEQCVNSTR